MKTKLFSVGKIEFKSYENKCSAKTPTQTIAELYPFVLKVKFREEK